jgi:hypothetical protein
VEASDINPLQQWVRAVTPPTAMPRTRSHASNAGGGLSGGEFEGAVSEGGSGSEAGRQGYDDAATGGGSVLQKFEEERRRQEEQVWRKSCSPTYSTLI